MTETTLARPKIVSRDEWVSARVAHLAQEKAATQQLDRLRAERRRLPTVKLETRYAFDGPDGKRGLLDLFAGRRQLIFYHFMFDPKRSKAEIEANRGPNAASGEEHGLSVFFRVDGDVFHTYSAYARGTESLTDAYSLLDMTPYGRQEDFEDSPPGWPQKPTYG